jgi:hypothetical protein
MAADGSIAGTVTGAGGGPIAGDQVCAQSTTSTFGYHCAVTASSGEYTIESVPTGNYRVHFEGKGEFVGEWYEDAPSESAGKLVAVAEGATAGGVDAELTVGATVEGVVTDASGGQALDHIQVCAATTISYPINNGCATSGPDGHYRLVGIPTGEYKLRFSPGFPGGDPDYLTLYYPDAERVEGGAPLHLVDGSTVTGIDVAMHLGGTISGTVLDGAGNPVQGARACVYPILGNTNGGYCIGHSATTLADGSYTIHGVPSGEYKVSFSTSQSGNYLPQFYPEQPTRSAGGAVTVTAPGAVAGIDATLQSGGVISGTLTESGTGQALFGLGVCANRIGGNTSFCAQTAADGSYSIRSLASGDYQVRFAGLESSFDWPYVPTSTTPVHVTASAETDGIGAALDKGGTISGEITDATSGEPAEGIYVCALSGGEVVGTCDTTHANGAYTIIGLPADSYAVRATPAGGGVEQDYLIGNRHYVPRFYPDATDAATATPVPSGPGVAVTGKDIEMREGGGIAGTVTGPLGEPLSGIEACVVRSADELGEDCAASDVGGHYEIAGLNPGDYVVAFWAAGSQTQFSQQYFQGTTDFASATPVAVTGSAVTPDIDAQMQPSGRVEGTVTDAYDGTPLADVWVCAEKIGGTGGNCTETAADGSYSMAVGSGTYTVEFSLGYRDEVDGEEVEVEEFRTQFFDGAADAATATAVTVGSGAISSGVDASLTLAPGRLDSVSVAPTGSGTGAITSTPAGIDCGATCAEEFETRKTVTLHAEPAPGSTFTGWSGACTGTGPCQVRLTAAANVSATFEPTGGNGGESDQGQGGGGSTSQQSSTPVTGTGTTPTPVKPRPVRPKPKRCKAGFKPKKVGKGTRCVRKPTRHPHRKHRAGGRSARRSPRPVSGGERIRTSVGRANGFTAHLL